MSVKGVKLMLESYFSISPGVLELWRKNLSRADSAPPPPIQIGLRRNTVPDCKRQERPETPISPMLPGIHLQKILCLLRATLQEFSNSLEGINFQQESYRREVRIHILIKFYLVSVPVCSLLCTESLIRYHSLILIQNFKLSQRGQGLKLE